MSVISKFGLTLNREIPTFTSNGKVFIPESTEVVAFSSAAGSNDYYCFPALAINPSNGHIYMFLGLSETHSGASVGGGNFFSKSTDNGDTWSAKSEIVETAGYGIAGICFTSTGRILVDCEEYDAPLQRHWFTYSDDDGQTWAALARMSTDYSDGIFAGPSSPRQLQTAILKALYANHSPGANENVIYISLNNGVSWTFKGKIYPIDSTNVEEPCIEVFTDNLLLSLNRTDPLVGIYSSWSPNAGATWSELKRAFPSIGKPGFTISQNNTCLAVGRNALRKNGNLGSDTQGQYNTIFATSPDKGQTWEYFPICTRDGGNMYGDAVYSTQAGQAILSYSAERGPIVNAGAADIIVRRFNEVDLSSVVVANEAYHAKSQAIINLATRAGFTLPSTAQLDAWNDFIAGLDADGIIALGDIFKIASCNNANTRDFHCLDILNPRAFMATRMSPVGAITYPDFSELGFKTNKTNNLWKMNYDPSLDKVNFSLNSCSMVVGITEAPTAGVTIGVFKTTGGSAFFQMNVFAAFYGLNDATTSIATPTKTGLFLQNRSASNAIQVERNGASLGTAATVSASIPAGEIAIGARKTETANTFDQWSDGRVDLIYVGGSLDATKRAAFATRYATYKTAIGL